MSDEHKTNQITLTAEQLVNIVGHAATQEQLDNVRRELDGKIESTARKVDAKIDASVNKLDSKIEKLDNKIDSTAKELRKEISKLDNRLWWIAGLIIALAFKTEILSFFQGG